MIPFLKYSYFKISPWKSKIKIKTEVNSIASTLELQY